MDIESQITDLAKRYEQSFVRPLVNLIPVVGSAIDSTITYIRMKRERVFFDKLAEHDVELTDEQIHSEDFIHAYYATRQAALHTRRREKIRLFANLFGNYIQGGDFGNTDSYEETLAILDDLSFREFQILLILNRFEARFPPEDDQNAVQRAVLYWDEFLASVESKLEISADQIPGMLARLNRTGLYETITGGFFDYGSSKGHLTPNFATFLDSLNIACDNDVEE